MTLEEQILKATDPALTTDNWQFILDVCDEISADPERNIPAAMRIFKQRLAQKDANIVLRSLTLLVAAGENCGSRMQQEIASSAFLKDSLLARLGDRKVHKELKFRIAEVIEQLDKSFKKDPSLKAVADAYAKVRSKYPQYLKSPPSKPAKTEMTAQDRKNEDAEFERALSLSVQEYEREQSVRKSYLDSKPLPAPQPNANDSNKQQTALNAAHTGGKKDAVGANNSEPKDPDTVTIANVKKVCALYDLISYEPDELSFRKGDIITVIESVYRDWWRGALPSGKTGIFPLNYVTPVVQKSPEELARESKLEAAIIDTESRKVDRLLALLSSNPDSVSEDEVTELYNSIVPLKPVLAKLIGKHSARRDELGALNEQVGAETKLYNNMIDGMIAQRQAPPAAVPYPADYSQGQGSAHQRHNPGYERQSAMIQAQIPGYYGQRGGQPTAQSVQTQSTHQIPNHTYQRESQPQPSQQQQYHAQPPQPTCYGNYLEQQPTSAGFGNGAAPSELPYSYGSHSVVRQPTQEALPQTSFPQQNY
ncbi:hypothetical protein OXX69_004296 [Metschnikowia pulcherrima]